MVRHYIYITLILLSACNQGRLNNQYNENASLCGLDSKVSTSNLIKVLDADGNEVSPDKLQISGAPLEGPKSCARLIEPNAKVIISKPDTNEAIVLSPKDYDGFTTVSLIRFKDETPVVTCKNGVYSNGSALSYPVALNGQDPESLILDLKFESQDLSWFGISPSSAKVEVDDLQYGSYQLNLGFKNIYQQEGLFLKDTCSLVVDRVSPTIKLKSSKDVFEPGEALSFEVGQALAPESLLYCFIEENQKDCDLEEQVGFLIQAPNPGSYKLKYGAKDLAGNSSSIEYFDLTVSQVSKIETIKALTTSANLFHETHQSDKAALTTLEAYSLAESLNNEDRKQVEDELWSALRMSYDGFIPKYIVENEELPLDGIVGDFLLLDSYSEPKLLNYVTGEKISVDKIVKCPNGVLTFSGDKVTLRTSTNQFETFPRRPSINDAPKYSGNCHKIVFKKESTWAYWNLKADKLIEIESTRLPVIIERQGEEKVIVDRDNLRLLCSVSKLSDCQEVLIDEIKGAKNIFFRGGNIIAVEDEQTSIFDVSFNLLKSIPKELVENKTLGLFGLYALEDRSIYSFRGEKIGKFSQNGFGVMSKKFLIERTSNFSPLSIKVIPSDRTSLSLRAPGSTRFWFIRIDGSKLAVQIRKQIKIFDLDSHAHKRILTPEGSSVDAKFTESGEVIYASIKGKNGALEVHLNGYEPKSGKRRRVKTGTPTAVDSSYFQSGEVVAIHEGEDRVVAVAGDTGFVNLYSLDDFKLLEKFQVSSKLLHSLSFDPTGRYLVITSNGDSVMVLDRKTGKKKYVSPYGIYKRAMFFGTGVLVSKSTQDLIYYDLKTRKTTVIDRKVVDDIDVNADLGLAAIIGNGLITIIDEKLKIQKQFSAEQTQRQGSLMSVKFSKNGILYIGRSDGYLKVDLESESSLRVLYDNESEFTKFIDENRNYLLNTSVNSIRLIPKDDRTIVKEICSAVKEFDQLAKCKDL